MTAPPTASQSGRDQLHTSAPAKAWPSKSVIELETVKVRVAGTAKLVCRSSITVLPSPDSKGVVGTGVLPDLRAKAAGTTESGEAHHNRVIDKNVGGVWARDARGDCRRRSIHGPGLAGEGLPTSAARQNG